MCSRVVFNEHFNSTSSQETMARHRQTRGQICTIWAPKILSKQKSFKIAFENISRECRISKVVQALRVVFQTVEPETDKGQYLTDTLTNGVAYILILWHDDRKRQLGLFCVSGAHVSLWGTLVQNHLNSGKAFCRGENSGVPWETVDTTCDVCAATLTRCEVSATVTVRCSCIMSHCNH